MADIAIPKKVGQNQGPNKAPFFIGFAVVLVIGIGIFLAGPFIDNILAAQPELPASLEPTATNTQVIVPTITPTATATATIVATNTEVPTEVPISNEELKALLNVSIVAHGNVSDDIVRYELLALQAVQKYLEKHGVISTFPEVRIEIANSKDSPIGCDFLTENSVYVIRQNIIKCKNDDQPYQWMASGANEAVNIYMQTANGVDNYNKVTTAGWIWIEGGAEYFAWQALLDANLVTTEQAFHTTEMMDGEVYTVSDLLNANNSLGPNKSTNIGYHFMDYLVHLNGSGPELVDQNIVKVYEVFSKIGQGFSLEGAVVKTFDIKLSDLYTDFLLKVKNKN